MMDNLQEDLERRTLLLKKRLREPDMKEIFEISINLL